MSRSTDRAAIIRELDAIAEEAVRLSAGDRHAAIMTAKAKFLRMPNILEYLAYESAQEFVGRVRHQVNTRIRAAKGEFAIEPVVHVCESVQQVQRGRWFTSLSVEPSLATCHGAAWEY